MRIQRRFIIIKLGKREHMRLGLALGNKKIPAPRLIRHRIRCLLTQKFTKQLNLLRIHFHNNH